MGLVAPKPTPLLNLTRSILQDTLDDSRLYGDLSECGVVVGSSRSFQGVWEDLTAELGGFIPLHPHPLEGWLLTLPYGVALEVARIIGSQGVVAAPMSACVTGLWAIAQAVELIETGQCERVIAGAVETPITPLTIAGFDRMGALATTGCYPFDIDREGLVLAEGGALLVLESESAAAERGAEIYGQVRGFSFTCDASGVSAPSTNPSSAIRAIRQCLERSGLRYEDIDYIHCHGTSTRLNDAREAGLIKDLFPDTVAVSSTKGATGHTLGASGVLGLVWSLLSLKEQILPPCVGLRNSAFELNILKNTTKTRVKNVLNFGFGFGGQNAVIAVSKY
jgi:3-oxoacyl-[acyl-carrier-protein] synthase II